MLYRIEARSERIGERLIDIDASSEREALLHTLYNYLLTETAPDQVLQITVVATGVDLAIVGEDFVTFVVAGQVV